MKKRDVFDQLTTEYSERMDRDVPWNFYPRPSMVRESFICLNGEWDFAVTDGDAPSEYVEKILVPFPPESALSGVKKEISADSTMYYRRSFSIDSPTEGKRVLLHFGAVDTYCEVWLNDVCVMRNAGGYLPFSTDVTDALLAENTLVVTVRDPLDGVYPYGKQTRTPGGMWYTPVSGIWQTVWLELVPEVYVERIRVRSYMDRAEVTVVGGASKKVLTLDDGERIEFESESVTVRPERPRLWTPDDPYLYHFTLECGEDSLRSYFALREISVERCKDIPRLCLNGEPLLINGLLDQGYFPDGLFLPATPDGYRDDILRTKEFGFNMLRKHIKIEPEIFYSLCDELGVIVFQGLQLPTRYGSADCGTEAHPRQEAPSGCRHPSGVPDADGEHARTPGVLPLGAVLHHLQRGVGAVLRRRCLRAGEVAGSYAHLRCHLRMVHAEQERRGFTSRILQGGKARQAHRQTYRYQRIRRLRSQSGGAPLRKIQLRVSHLFGAREI